MRSGSKRLLAAAFALELSAVDPALAADPADEALFAYGRHLAAACAACHRERPENAPRMSGAPDIWRMPYGEFERRFTQAKTRSSNEAVRLMLSSLSEGDMEALLYYFEHR